MLGERGQTRYYQCYMISTLSFSRLAAVPVIAFALLVPLAAGAQGVESQESLRATIHAAIQADPRAASMTPGQIDQLADALAVEAQAKGMTAQEILWRPTVPAPEGEATRLPGVPFMLECGDESSVLCRINHALGLDGTNLMIPLALGIGAALFLLVLAMLVMHHKHEQVTMTPPPPLF